MRFLNALIGATLIIPAANAIDIKVESIERVPVRSNVGVYHPIFTPDGSQLMVSDEAYNGIGLLDIKSGAYRQLTDAPGAAYKAVISPDGSQILAREMHFDEQTVSLFTINIDNAKVTPVASHIQHVNNVAINNGIVEFPTENAVRTWVDPTMPRTMSAGDTKPTTIVTEEDLKLVVYKDGVRNVVDPILETTGRDVNYCWSSLSPDGTRMLFVAHNDAYTSNLDGSDLVCLGILHAPVWRDDNTVVGMVDADDGHFFTASDIVIADAKTAETVQLTPVSDDIKMFPSVSPDGNRIAYHTLEGEIYIINLSTYAK